MFRFTILYILLLHVYTILSLNGTSTNTKEVGPGLFVNNEQTEFNITNINGMHHEYFDRVICRHNPDVCEPKCKLQFKTRLTKSMTAGCTVLKQPSKSFLQRAQMYYRFTGGYRKFLVEEVEDICKFLNGVKGQRILAMIFPKIKKTLNLNDHCPITDKMMVNDLVLGLYIVNNPLLPAVAIYFNIPDGKSILDYAMG